MLVGFDQFRVVPRFTLVQAEGGRWRSRKWPIFYPRYFACVRRWLKFMAGFRVRLTVIYSASNN